MKQYSKKDYYSLLGLHFDASKEDIKKAFRKAAVKYHPDVNKDGNEIFLEIKEAYEVLVDDSKRKNYDFVNGYDLKRKQKQEDEINSKIRKENFSSKSSDKKNESFEKQQSSSYSKSENHYNYRNEYKSTEINSEDVKKTSSKNGQNSSIHIKENTFGDTLKGILGNLFKGHSKFDTQDLKDSVDGSDITMPIEISYKEALNGTNRKINVLHTEVCPVCGGKKFTNGSNCKYCKGIGEISLHKKLNVKIPPHTENNKKIRLKDEGTKGLKGGKNGNLYLIVKITDDSFFKFEGNNVLCETEISPYEAALGGEKDVKTLSGSVKLKIPKGTSSGQKFRLAKEGLFDENTKTKGDLIVTIKIKVDENLSEREKQLYEELRNISNNK